MLFQLFLIHRLRCNLSSHLDRTSTQIGKTLCKLDGVHLAETATTTTTIQIPIPIPIPILIQMEVEMAKMAKMAKMGTKMSACPMLQCRRTPVHRRKEMGGSHRPRQHPRWLVGRTCDNWYRQFMRRSVLVSFHLAITGPLLLSMGTREWLVQLQGPLVRQDLQE